jgi:hypothetical protein
VNESLDLLSCAKLSGDAKDVAADVAVETFPIISYHLTIDSQQIFGISFASTSGFQARFAN